MANLVTNFVTNEDETGRATEFALSDVVVTHLGLVANGATHERFFLLKSKEGGDSVSELVTESEVLEPVGEVAATPSETLLTPSETLLQKFARWIGLQVHDNVTKALADVDVTKASFTDAAWDGSAVESNLSTEDYAKVCLIDLNEPDQEKKKSLLKLPIKATPDGPYNRNALRAAWGAVHGARTPMTGVPANVMTATRNRLQRLMAQAGIEVSKQEVESTELATNGTASALSTVTKVEAPANNLPNGDLPLPLNSNPILSSTSNSIINPVIKEEIPMADTNDYELLKSSLAEIQKANTDLQARVAKAEAEAVTAQDEKVHRVWLEKANTLLAVPVPSSELADQLHWLAKADPARAAWWDKVLNTVDHMLIDFGTYVEKGSTRLPDYLEPVDKALKAADPRAALLGLPAEAQRAYIARQNAQAKA